jgi:hypothetical protein
MDSKQNANKHDLKKIQLFLQCLEGRPFSSGQFSAMITLKMWRSWPPGPRIVGAAQ